MKRILILVLLALLIFSCSAEENREMTAAELMPVIRIGETTFADVQALPDSGNYWKFKPLTADTNFEFEDGSSLRLTYRYFNGDYRVTYIAFNSDVICECTSGSPVTCPGDIVPGCTTIAQLQASGDKLNLTDILEYGDSAAADICSGGINYCVWFKKYGDDYVCDRIYITDNTAELEKACGAECTDYTVADFRELSIFESGYGEVTAAFPGYVIDTVELSHPTAPVKSVIYLLSDHTHLTLEFMEFDGEWKLAGICWIPEDANAAGISPDPNDGNKYTKTMYAENLDWLTVGCTTFNEVDKRYMDHWGYAISQDSIDHRIMTENGDSVDLFFVSFGDERVLYAMRCSEMFDTNIRPKENSGY